MAQKTRSTIRSYVTVAVAATAISLSSVNADAQGRSIHQTAGGSAGFGGSTSQGIHQTVNQGVNIGQPQGIHQGPVNTVNFGGGNRGTCPTPFQGGNGTWNHGQGGFFDHNPIRTGPSREGWDGSSGDHRQGADGFGQGRGTGGETGNRGQGWNDSGRQGNRQTQGGNWGQNGHFNWSSHSGSQNGASGNTGSSLSTSSQGRGNSGYGSTTVNNYNSSSSWSQGGRSFYGGQRYNYGGNNNMFFVGGGWYNGWNCGCFCPYGAPTYWISGTPYQIGIYYNPYGVPVQVVDVPVSTINYVQQQGGAQPQGDASSDGRGAMTDQQTASELHRFESDVKEKINGIEGQLSTLIRNSVASMGQAGNTNGVVPPGTKTAPSTTHTGLIIGGIAGAGALSLFGAKLLRRKKNTAAGAAGT